MGEKLLRLAKTFSVLYSRDSEEKKVEGSKRAKQLELRATLRDIHVPKDIIVSTPEEFEWRKEIVGTIERPAVREGRVLYARP